MDIDCRYLQSIPKTDLYLMLLRGLVGKSVELSFSLAANVFADFRKAAIASCDGVNVNEYLERIMCNFDIPSHSLGGGKPFIGPRRRRDKLKEHLIVLAPHCTLANHFHYILPVLLASPEWPAERTGKVIRSSPADGLSPPLGEVAVERFVDFFFCHHLGTCDRHDDPFSRIELRFSSFKKLTL